MTAATAFLLGAESAPPARQTWEYLDCGTSSVVGEDAHGRDLGAEGWELVAVLSETPPGRVLHFYYKRPK